MAFELKAPDGGDFASLRARLPALLIYILSFTFIGIYWNNHHHLLRAARRVTGAVMWANLHLLFWLSLIPVLTEWVGEHYEDHAPAATYGFVCLAAGVAFTILVRAIIRADGSSSLVATAIGSDTKGRISLLAYASATVLAYVSPWISYALFVAVALMWFIPDRRLSRERLTRLLPLRSMCLACPSGAVRRGARAVQPVRDAPGQDRHRERAVVEHGGVECGQRERRA
jgi:uncharacterized membrane protein